MRLFLLTIVGLTLVVVGVICTIIQWRYGVSQKFSKYLFGVMCTSIGGVILIVREVYYIWG